MTLTHYVLLSLVFLSQLLLHSAQEFKQTRGCPSFRCGKLGEVGFPFSNTTNPACGLCRLNCTGPEPKVQWHEHGRWHKVHYLNFSTQTIEMNFRLVPTKLLESNHCRLVRNFTFEASPSFSVNVTESHQIIKCKKHKPHPEFSHEFRNYSGCKDYDLYFYDDQEKCLPTVYETPSNSCMVVNLPSTSLQSLQSCLADNLTLPWDGIFRINWRILPACSKCYLKGGQCLSRPDQTFECGNFKKGFILSRRVLIGIGVSIGVVGIFLTCIIFIIYQCRKRKKLSRSSSLISQDICNDPSLKTDLDHGSIYFQTPIFTYKELHEATNHFDSNKKLGHGGFGTVYHGKLHDGRTVAVKRLYEHNFKRVEQFMNEIEILSRLCHPNLVSLYGCTNRYSHELLLVYEYVPNGTVADHLHGDHANARFLTWPIRMRIAVESANALAYLHASDIIHRDIKSSNILLDHGFHVKVGDFGLSRLFPTDVTHVSTSPQGTPGYVDPEYYQCYQLNDKSDVYSFGVVLIELISSKPAVDTSRHRHEVNLANMAINKIYNRSLHELVDQTLGFYSDCSIRDMITMVAELAFRCLQQEKEMRPCMIEVLETLQWIQGKYMTKKTDEIEVSADARLLKNIQPFSPDSVTNKWISTSTTPNTSG